MGSAPAFLHGFLAVYRAGNIVTVLVVMILMAGLASDDAQVQLSHGNLRTGTYLWKTRCLKTSNHRLPGAIEFVWIQHLRIGMMAATRKSKSEKLKQKQKRTSPTEASGDSCPHCAGGPETYGYLKRAFVYDVDRARKIVSDGREPVEMDDSDVEYCVDNSRIHEQHLDHVDPKYPGILAHLWGPGEDGTLEHGHLLIDGNHRAARCLRDGLTYRAYLLTEDESEQILLRGTDRNGHMHGG